jgi:hypothetical protein
LTESQYFERLAFEHPLDIRLRGDILEKGLLFIGYRLSDVNIRYLLFKLQRIWKTYEGRQKRPSSFIFLSRPNVVQETVLRERGVTPIIADTDTPTEALTEFLHNLYDAIKVAVKTE